MEPRDTLGPSGGSLRSQVGAENGRVRGIDRGIDRPTAASVLTNSASLIGVVEEAGIDNNASNLVADGVGAVVAGMNGRWSRGDIISHIDRSRDQQASRLCESLGSILHNIVHPPRTVADIAIDYRNAERSLRDAASDKSKRFWSSICMKLSSELSNLN